MNLTFSKVAFAYGSRRVIDEVSLTVASGEIVTLTGANGVGKTTVLRLVVGLLLPDAGSIALDGHELRARTVSQRKRFGYVPAESILYPGLTIWENARAFGRLWMVDRASLNDRGRPLFASFGLDLASTLPARALSRGTQQRLALAVALLHDPDLLVLDEPFSNLDIEGRDIVRFALETRASRGKAVLLASHDREAMTGSSRALLLAEGRIRNVGA